MSSPPDKTQQLTKEEEEHETGFEEESAHKLGVNIRRTLTKKADEFQKAWSTPSTTTTEDKKHWTLDEVRWWM
eukprot:scaffold5783_cov129-Amphora_coffeaeformis.AAC.7